MTGQKDVNTGYPLRLRAEPRRALALSLLLTGSLLLAACQTTATESRRSPQAADLEVECQDPRPEMCTQQYDPVCALRDSGTRCVTEPCPATERETYSNGCMACSDPKVLGHKTGACEDLEESQ